MNCVQNHENYRAKIVCPKHIFPVQFWVASVEKSKPVYPQDVKQNVDKVKWPQEPYVGVIVLFHIVSEDQGYVDETKNEIPYHANVQSNI